MIIWAEGVRNLRRLFVIIPQILLGAVTLAVRCMGVLFILSLSVSLDSHPFPWNMIFSEGAAAVLDNTSVYNKRCTVLRTTASRFFARESCAIRLFPSAMLILIPVIITHICR